MKLEVEDMEREKGAGRQVIAAGSAEKDLDFQHIAEVIDISKGADLERVAWMPR